MVHYRTEKAEIRAKGGAGERRGSVLFFILCLWDFKREFQ